MPSNSGIEGRGRKEGRRKRRKKGSASRPTPDYCEAGREAGREASTFSPPQQKGDSSSFSGSCSFHVYIARQPWKRLHSRRDIQIRYNFMRVSVTNKT